MFRGARPAQSRPRFIEGLSHRPGHHVFHRRLGLRGKTALHILKRCRFLKYRAPLRTHPEIHSQMRGEIHLLPGGVVDLNTAHAGCGRPESLRERNRFRPVHGLLPTGQYGADIARNIRGGYQVAAHAFG